MERIYCFLIGYAAGCVAWAYFFGRIAKGIDIREYGSGNAGTTNVIRVLGKKWGIATLVLDILKGVLGVVICAFLYGYEAKHLLFWAGLGVVMGHNYPFYLRFRGGKGIAASVGVVLAADPRIFALCLLPVLMVLYLSKYMSLASLTAMMLLVMFSIVFYLGAPNGLEVIGLCVCLAVSGFFRHRGNIKRLLAGTEAKMGQNVSIDQKSDKH